MSKEATKQAKEKFHLMRETETHLSPEGVAEITAGTAPTTGRHIRAVLED